MVDLNTLFWGSPLGYAGAQSVVDQNRRALGARMGLPPGSPGPMAAGRAAERNVPAMDLSAIRAAQEEAERLAQLQMPKVDPLTGNPIRTPNYTPPKPAAGVTSNPYLNGAQPSGAGVMNDPNALTPAMDRPIGPNGGAASGATTFPANVPLPPQRPADLGGTGQPSYFTVDPGDGGVLRTFMSPNGQAPNIPGATINPLGNQDMGILAKLLRGAF